MPRLRLRDLRALHTCLRQSYAVRDLAAFPHHIVDALRDVVPADWVWYNEANPAKNRITWVIDPLDTFPGAERVFAECMHEHPCLLEAGRVPNGQSWHLSDFLPRARLHQLRIYNEFYRRRGIEYQLGIRLAASPSCVIAVGVNRGPHRRDFAGDHALCMDVLGPHLVEAYRNAEAFTQFREELRQVRRIEDLARGLVVVEGGRVTWISPRARQLLEKYVGWSSRRAGALPEILSTWMAYQHDLLARDDEVPLPRRPLLIDRGAHCLRVRLLADARRSLLLLDERPGDIEPAALAKLGLTQRETQVLNWVAHGKTNEVIATILGARPSTIAKHLEHIFRKLGVETRTAAAARAFEASGWRG
jgi:DNA-binding CsgD family transcriptional regulator